MRYALKHRPAAFHVLREHLQKNARPEVIL